jgi:hypothetical protein
MSNIYIKYFDNLLAKKLNNPPTGHLKIAAAGYYEHTLMPNGDVYMYYLGGENYSYDNEERSHLKWEDEWALADNEFIVEL